MSQNATPLKLEDVAELERYLITKHKRSGIDVSLVNSIRCCREQERSYD